MTQKIYHKDAYQRDFTAVVESKRKDFEGTAVALDQTCFYPTSGGQPCDRGRLSGLKISSVEEEEGAVFHRLADDQLEVGQEVTGSIDWAVRFDHMQQHTGQHLLSQAFIRVIQAETVSFHLGRESSTIDLDVDGFTNLPESRT